MKQRLHSKRFRAGLSMTEVVVSTMLVGLVLVGAMKGAGAVMKTWESGESQHDGTALAQLLMAEVMQMPYEDSSSPIFGNETGEGAGNRSKWDDVDDYHSWSKSPPTDKLGAHLEGYAGWTRSTVVQRVKRSDPSSTTTMDEGLKRIKVSVTDPNGKVTTLVGYRSRFGGLEGLPSSSATIHTLVTDEFKVDQRKHYGGVHLNNYATD